MKKDNNIIRMTRKEALSISDLIQYYKEFQPGKESKIIPLEETKDIKILIFIGRGKSTLARFIKGKYFMEPKGNKDIIAIKEGAEKGTVVIHLTGNSSYDKLPSSIKRRALKFYINF